MYIHRQNKSSNSVPHRKTSSRNFKSKLRQLSHLEIVKPSNCNVTLEYNFPFPRQSKYNSTHVNQQILQDNWSTDFEYRKWINLISEVIHT